MHRNKKYISFFLARIGSYAIIRQWPLQIICTVLILLSHPVKAQTEEDEGVEEEEEKLERFEKKAFPDRSKILRQLQWNWQSLGPATRPAELQPGGDGIPLYAANRGNGTGRINYLYISRKNPDRLWACSPTGGLWYSIDRGESWISGGTDALPISGVASLAVNEDNTQEWIVATGDGDDVFMFSDGLWYTNDGGKHYISLNGQWENWIIPYGEFDQMDAQISDVKALPGSFNTFFVATSQGLYRNNKKKGSESIRWSKILDGDFYDIEIIPVNKRRNIVIASGTKCYVSMNSGRSFEEMPAPVISDPEKNKFVRINVERSWQHTDWVYAAVTCSESRTQSAQGEGTLQVLDLKAKSWRKINSFKNYGNVIPTRARAFAVSPADDHVLMIGNVQPLYRSTDGGITFSKIEPNQMHDDCHAIVISPGGENVFASHDGGVSKSTDGGVHWFASDNGIAAANIFGLSTAQTQLPQVLYGGYDVGGNLLREGKWWHVNWGDGFETAISQRDSNIMYSSSQNGMMYRTSGPSLNFENVKMPPSVKTEWHTWLRLHPLHDSVLFVSGQRLCRSVDGGNGWEVIFDCKKYNKSHFSVYRFYLSETSPSCMYLYVIDDSHDVHHIYRTFNLNEKTASDIVWEEITKPPVLGWIERIVPDPEDPRRCWVLYNRTEETGKIYSFSNGEWEDLTTNLHQARCESMVLQRGSEKRLYLGSNYGVFTKSKNESQWTLLSGLPGTYIKALDINYEADKLVVGTFGRGVWWGDLLHK